MQTYLVRSSSEHPTRNTGPRSPQWLCCASQPPKICITLSTGRSVSDRRSWSGCAFCCEHDTYFRQLFGAPQPGAPIAGEQSTGESCADTTAPYGCIHGDKAGHVCHIDACMCMRPAVCSLIRNCPSFSYPKKKRSCSYLLTC